MQFIMVNHRISPDLNLAELMVRKCENMNREPWGSALIPSENRVGGHRSISRQIRLSDANRSDLRFWNNIDEMCEHGQALRTRLKPVRLFRYYLICFVMVPIDYL
jgi:hypothetical protein